MIEKCPTCKEKAIRDIWIWKEDKAILIHECKYDHIWEANNINNKIEVEEVRGKLTKKKEIPEEA